MNIPCHFMTAFRFSGLKGAEAVCIYTYHNCAKHINVAFQAMHSNSSSLHLTIKCQSDPTLIARNHKMARQERFYCWQQQCSATTYLLVFSAWGSGREDGTAGEHPSPLRTSPGCLTSEQGIQANPGLTMQLSRTDKGI